jgi:predicted SAM-dependent methyltransferase
LLEKRYYFYTLWITDIKAKVKKNYKKYIEKSNTYMELLRTSKSVLKNITPPFIWKFVKIIASRFKQKNSLSLPVLDNKDCIKLHLGCGTVYKEGWTNIDNNSDNNIQKLDFNWDLRKPLPFPDNSADFIFNEHFLEHLTVDEGISTIRDFYRVLKLGGIMRIAMPDLQNTITAYFDQNWKENNKEFFEKFGLTFIQTRAERINIGFRWWGHKWLYDWEELERRLKEAGCEKIKHCVISESDYEELRNLETRNESTLIAEVTKV